MFVHTPTQQVLAVPSLAALSRTASANGAAVDRLGYENVMVALHIGAHDRTTGDETLDVKIQESADGSTGWADITGAAFTQIAAQTIAATVGNVYTMSIRPDGRKRYYRAVSTSAGTTPIDVFSVVFYLFNPHVAPVTQTATPIVV